MEVPGKKTAVFVENIYIMMSSVSIGFCAFQLGQIIPEGVRQSRIWEWILPNGEFSVGKLINLYIASHVDCILQLSMEV